MRFLQTLGLLAAFGLATSYDPEPYVWRPHKPTKPRPADPVKKAHRKAQGKARAKSRKR